jgi:hypothetical protein
MATLHFKVLGGALLGLLVAATAVTLLSVPRKTSPTVELPPAEAPAPAPAAAPEPAPAADPITSRSRGQSDWAFFFRPGDTLSRMREGTPLGVVVRLEREHRFVDGSTGPAYVIRTPDQGELVLDADELERRARIESVREFRLPPARAAETASTR